MQAGQLTIANSNVAQVSGSARAGNLGGWITRLFGCWHREMSRPFSHQGHAYRSCLHCGARRQFNLRNWEMQGEFYYYQPNRGQLQKMAGLAVVGGSAN